VVYLRAYPFGEFSIFSPTHDGSFAGALSPSGIPVYLTKTDTLGSASRYLQACVPLLRRKLKKGGIKNEPGEKRNTKRK
jgi:hypothetical protein